MQSNLLFNIFEYITYIYYKICNIFLKIAQINRIRISKNNNMTENFILYCKYFIITNLSLNKNKVTNLLIWILDIETDIIGFEVTKNDILIGKIIKCNLLSEGIRLLHDNIDNKYDTIDTLNNDLDISKIVRINVISDNEEINILPEMMKYLYQKNNMIDFLKLNFPKITKKNYKIKFETMEDFFTTKCIFYDVNNFENKTIDLLINDSLNRSICE
jgi:hypothetical protein